MVLRVVSSNGDIMPPHFFEQGLWVNADGYIHVLETIVKPWMDLVANGSPYVFQQDSALAWQDEHRPGSMTTCYTTGHQICGPLAPLTATHWTTLSGALLRRKLIGPIQHHWCSHASHC